MASKNRKEPDRSGQRGVVFKLARADLRHEWILTLCLIMAVAAVLSPLMIIFGLKNGTVETLRHRLIQDPRNREIRPETSRTFDRPWFEQIKARPEVSFIIPKTRELSATVDVSLKKGGPEVQLDVIPTADGDPLVLENDSIIPGPGQCVLTARAAKTLGASTTDLLNIRVRRFVESTGESGEFELKVAGILSPRAGELKWIFVRLDILEDIETYKDGGAVPRYGWTGSTPEAYPVYSGLVVCLSVELDKLDELKMINGTGFNRIERLTPEQLAERAGYRLDEKLAVYLLSTQKKPVKQTSIEAVKNRLRGKNPCLLPWVSDLGAEILTPEGLPLADLHLQALAVDPGQGRALGLTPDPDWGEPGNQARDWRRIMLPAGVAATDGEVQIKVVNGPAELKFPVRPLKEKTVEGNTAFIPPPLAGILNLFKERAVTHDEKLDKFLLSRRGYPGFRLYASSIDRVDDLRLYFENQGLGVHTEAARIRDVLELDSYLSLIFRLVAIVGLLGGTACLLASLYASVERKRKDLSILRLLGLSGGILIRFPMYQGLMIASGGYLVALVFFQILAGVINSLFKKHLEAAESLCRISWQHLGLALMITTLIAVVSAGAAAWRIAGIDPAEALRDE